jgi:large subunit ribosomal protein L23
MNKHTGTIILSPRITEKGAVMAEQGVYVFNVAKDANKREIAQAISTLYKVTPREVRVARVPRKQVTTRNTNRKGMTAGGKKAYVYLKEGDKIEIA